MKFKKMILIPLLINLISTTPAPAQSQTVLQKNDLAPYTGVLIPEETYRKMHVDIFASQEFQEHFKACEFERLSLIQNSEVEHAQGFSYGVAFGVLASLLIVSVSK
jgi:hypothetical protein